jgi:spermidine/putrescine-binding protein
MMKKALKAAVLSGIAAMFSVALAGNAVAAQTQTAVP